MEKGRSKASVPRDADITQLQTEPAKASREIEPAGTKSRETSSLTGLSQILCKYRRAMQNRAKII